MHENQGETDCKTGQVACPVFSVSGAENDEDEDECCYNLNEECAPDTASIGNTIGSTHFCTGYAAEPKQDGSSENTSEELGNPVSAGVLPGHSAAHCDTEGDCRIDVATGNATDSVSHCNDRESECESGCRNTGRLTTSYEDCCSAAHECQNHCPDELSKILFHAHIIFVMPEISPALQI